MLKLCSYINFSRNGSDLLSITYVCEVEITTSWELLTQTAKLEIPAKIFKDNNQYSITQIQRGDAIQIWLGYVTDGINKKNAPSLTKRYQGYVTKIKPGYVVKLECEDEMWKLKQTALPGVLLPSPCTLSTLITWCQNQTGLTFKTNLSDTSDLGAIQISPGNSFADILEFIRNKYLFLAYFKNGTLVMNRVVQFVATNTQTFIVQRNIIGADTLEYQNVLDVHLSIKFTTQISVNGAPDKKTTIYVFYNSKGVLTNSTIPPVGYNQIEHITSVAMPESQMISEAGQILKSQTYTGYKGHIETFGEPVVNFGDLALIQDYRYPERTGTYLIRAVDVKFGKQGYRQTVNIYGKQ